MSSGMYLNLGHLNLEAAAHPLSVLVRVSYGYLKFRQAAGSPEPPRPRTVPKPLILPCGVEQTGIYPGRVAGLP